MQLPVLILTLVAIGAAFVSAIGAQALPRGTAAFVDPESAHVTAIHALGERVITQPNGNLLAEVTTALTQSGLEKGLDVCGLKALLLTRGTVSGQPRIIVVKRTSQRLRNPANTLDAAEKLALSRVERGLIGVSVSAGPPDPAPTPSNR